MSLKLKRKIGQQVIINKDVLLTVSNFEQGLIELMFEFPSNHTVFRKELVDKATANGTLDELFKQKPTYYPIEEIDKIINQELAPDNTGNFTMTRGQLHYLIEAVKSDVFDKDK